MQTVAKKGEWLHPCGGCHVKTNQSIINMLIINKQGLPWNGPFLGALTFNSTWVIHADSHLLWQLVCCCHRIDIHRVQAVNKHGHFSFWEVRETATLVSLSLRKDRKRQYFYTRLKLITKWTNTESGRKLTFSNLFKRFPTSPFRLLHNMICKL